MRRIRNIWCDAKAIVPDVSVEVVIRPVRVRQPAVRRKASVIFSNSSFKTPHSFFEMKPCKQRGKRAYALLVSSCALALALVSFLVLEKAAKGENARERKEERKEERREEKGLGAIV